MTLHIRLRPFTSYAAEELGPLLNKIVAAPHNDHFVVDFPNIWDFYGSRRRAIKTVRARQELMRTAERPYASLAVELGPQPSRAKIYGVTTTAMSQIPGSHQWGPNMAIWLDARRPKNLKGIGQRLLMERISWLLAHGMFSGRIWTIIRPDNVASRRAWTQGRYPMQLNPTGKPQSYSGVDGVRTPRQLYVADTTLERLRLRG